jgi:hypothetical protein
MGFFPRLFSVYALRVNKHFLDAAADDDDDVGKSDF